MFSALPLSRSLALQLPFPPPAQSCRSSVHIFKDLGIIPPPNPKWQPCRIVIKLGRCSFYAPDYRCCNTLARIVSLVGLTGVVPAQFNFTSPGLALSSDCDLFKFVSRCVAECQEDARKLLTPPDNVSPAIAVAGPMHVVEGRRRSFIIEVSCDKSLDSG